MLSRDALLEAPPAFEHRSHVRFVDAGDRGRLYAPKTLELFHDAYEALLAKGGVPLSGVLREKKWGAPLVHADAEIVGDLPRFGDETNVSIVRALVGAHAISFGYRATDATSGAPFAIGRTVHAFVDMATMKKAAVPDSVKDVLARLPSDAVAPDEGTKDAASAARREELSKAPPRFSYRVAVSDDDVDAAGLVFFARLCSYFHRAYAAMTKTPPRMAATEADFFRPLRPGDEADVLVVSSAFADGRATIGFRIVGAAGGTVAIGTLAHAATAPVELPSPVA